MSDAAAASVRVSYVVLCWNSARHIERCVRSLAAQAGPGDLDEIWVIDNGSTDESGAILRRLETDLDPILRVLSLPMNTGTTVSRNKALRLATGRYIAIVDSDVDVPSGVVDRLVADIGELPDCGILAPRLLYPDGRAQLSADSFPTLWRKIERVFRLRTLERTEAKACGTEGFRAVDYAISAFWLIPRCVLEEVGLLDERIFYSPEDVDYCIRVGLTGRTIVVDHAVAVVHDAQEISRRWFPNVMTFRHTAGLLYLFRKHRYSLGTSRLRSRMIVNAAGGLEGPHRERRGDRL